MIWAYSIFILIILPLILIPLGLFINKILKKYNFENNAINVILISGSFLANPFIILISFVLVSIIFHPYTTLNDCANASKFISSVYISYFIFQYILFLVISLILGIANYIFWIKNQKKSIKSKESIELFTRYHAIQTPYLLFYIYPFISKDFIVCDYDILLAYYFEIPSLLLGGFIIIIYNYFKSTRKKNING